MVTTDVEAMAMKVLDDFMASANTQDSGAQKATYNFPHIRIAGDEVLIFNEDNGAWKFPSIRGEKGWHRSDWDYRKVIQKSADKVHIAARFTRYREDDTPIASYETLYVITNQNGHWGIQARSSFAG
jgi:hypothetical protein